MNLQAQYETSGSTEKRLPPRELAVDDWMAGRHVQNIIEKFPYIKNSLEHVLTSKVMKAAMARAMKTSVHTLEQELVSDLRDGFVGIEGEAPRTIADLDAREDSGGLSEYFAQRLTTVSSLTDVGAMMPISMELKATLQNESDRLARLLVAFFCAEQKIDEDVI